MLLLVPHPFFSSALFLAPATLLLSASAFSVKAREIEKAD